MYNHKRNQHYLNIKMGINFYALGYNAGRSGRMREEDIVVKQLDSETFYLNGGTYAGTGAIMRRAEFDYTIGLRSGRHHRYPQEQLERAAAEQAMSVS